MTLKTGAAEKRRNSLERFAYDFTVRFLTAAPPDSLRSNPLSSTLMQPVSAVPTPATTP
jgi:hypothetical protein